jgi:hypothetical protein
MNNIDFMRLKRLGAEGERLLADGTFREMLVDLKNRAIREWANTKSDGSEIREELYRDIKAVGRLENYLADLGQQYRAEAQKAEAKDKQNGLRS